MAHDESLERTAELLATELHSERYRDPRYLRWLYDENPLGPAIRGSTVDDLGAIAHYALVPQIWRSPAGDIRLAISLNAAVAARAQRQGRFTALARELFEEAGAAGIAGTLTVANANSTPAFLRNLGLRTVRSLPVRLSSVLASGAGITSTAVDAQLLASPRIAALADELARVPTVRWVQHWSAAQLRWRLGSPIGEYVLHESDDLVAVTTLEHAFGTRVAVVLKLWPRTSRPRVSARRVIAAACRVHRTPLALYAGFNPRVHVPGVPVPRRLLPSPLNLLAGTFHDGRQPADLAPDTYEFLDADHY